MVGISCTESKMIFLVTKDGPINSFLRKLPRFNRCYRQILMRMRAYWRNLGACWDLIRGFDFLAEIDLILATGLTENTKLAATARRNEKWKWFWKSYFMRKGCGLNIYFLWKKLRMNSLPLILERHLHTSRVRARTLLEVIYWKEFLFHELKEV